MPDLNIFEDDAFSLQSMTASINNEPYRPGQVGALDLFEEDSVTTTTVSIEQRDGALSLVEPSERGGPGETVKGDSRSIVPVRVPHYERNDAMMADEVQNVRAFGSETELEQVQDRVDRKLFRHGRDLTMTLEHQRIGALKGIVMSKKGVVIANLYNIFGFAVPVPISLELDVEATKVGQVFQGVIHQMEDLLDGTYEGLHVLTGRDFHNALWTHKTVVETFIHHDGAATLRQEVPDKFNLFGATWERYKTGRRATEDLGSGYIANDEARVFFKGVPDLFITRFAPADYMETVNTPGLPFYAKQIPMKNDKGIDLEIQSNPISLCTRPDTLFKLTLT